MNGKPFSSNVSSIRNSTYAHAVREAIASALEQINDAVNEGIKLSVDENTTDTLKGYVDETVAAEVLKYNNLISVANGRLVEETREYPIYKNKVESHETILNGDDNTEGLVAKVTELEETVTSRLTDVNEVLNGTDDTDGLVDRVSALESNTGSNLPNGGTSTDTSAINRELTRLDGRLDTLEGQTLDERISTIEGYDVDTRLTTVEDQNLDARLKTIEETHVQTIAEHTDEIEVLQNSVGIHETLSADRFDTYGYIRAKGYLPYNAAYGTSDFIPVIPGEEITVEHQSIGSAYYIVLYDELKNWFDSVQSTVQADSRVQTQVVVPEGAYYMRVSAPRANPKIDIYRNVNNLKKITDEANLQIGNHVRYHDGTDLEFTMTENQRVWINDETSANLNSSPTTTITLNDETYPAYWKSNIIDISGYDRLELRAPITNASAGYAFLTGYQVIAAGGSPTGNRSGSLATFMLDVPEGADGFIFSCYIGQDVLTEYLERIVNELTTHQYDLIMLRGYVTGKNYQNGSKAFYESARTNYPPYERLMYGTIECIGDSLTVGALPKGDTNTDNNYSGVATVDYPSWINELSTLPTSKKAVSGYSASSWWNDNNMSKNFTSPAYIIWLGTNEGPTGIPAESSTDDPEGSELRYYRMIIEKIIEDVPTAKIFLGHVFATKTDNGNIRSVNQCIDAIAAAYPDNVVGVAKLDDGSLYGPTKGHLHGGLPRNPHFSNAGYMYLANKWVSEIRRCIAERIDMF